MNKLAIIILLLICSNVFSQIIRQNIRTNTQIDTLNWGSFDMNSEGYFRMGDLDSLALKPPFGDDWGYELPLYVFKNKHNWWGAFGAQNLLDDEVFGDDTYGETGTYGGRFELDLIFDEGSDQITNLNLHGASTTMSIDVRSPAKITGSNYSSFSNVISANQNEILIRPGHDSNIPVLMAQRNYIQPLNTTPNDTVDMVIGTYSGIRERNMVYTQAVGYYSDFIDAPSGTGYHFFGEGSYPSVFQGNIYAGDSSTEGVIIKSPDGKNWMLKIANDGTVSADSTGLN